MCIYNARNKSEKRYLFSKVILDQGRKIRTDAVFMALQYTVINYTAFRRVESLPNPLPHSSSPFQIQLLVMYCRSGNISDRAWDMFNE